MLNILYVNNFIDPTLGGGASERAVRLSNAFSRMGHKVTILAVVLDTTKLDNLNIEQDVRTFFLKCLIKRFYIPYFSFFKIRKLVVSSDIVLLNGHWSILNVLVYFLVRVEFKKYILTPLGTLPIFGRSKLFKFIYNKIIGYNLVKNASAHISVTNKELTQAGNYPFNMSNFYVIANGVDSDSFDYVDPELFVSNYIFNNSPFILFMGRLNKIKGPDLLLNAFLKIAEKFPQFLLIFVGPDEGEMFELIKISKNTGYESRVRFIGPLHGDMKLSAYRGATLLVVPSRSEAMSIVVLESGATGTPVLITDECGFDELNEVICGSVVKANVDAIALGLDRLLINPSALNESGKKLKSYINKNYSWDKSAQAYLDVINKILL